MGEYPLIECIRGTRGFAGVTKTFGQGPSEVGAGSPPEQVQGAFLETPARYKDAFQVTAVSGAVPNDDFFPVAIDLNRDGQFFFHGFSFFCKAFSISPPERSVRTISVYLIGKNFKKVHFRNPAPQNGDCLHGVCVPCGYPSNNPIEAGLEPPRVSPRQKEQLTSRHDQWGK
jgi:hypothetical protein